MQEKTEILEQLGEAIGGQWQITSADMAVQGYTASFPRFHGAAVVGVINDAADRAAVQLQAIAFGSGMGRLHDADPNMLCSVVIPYELAENHDFRLQLEEGLKQRITQVVSLQMCSAAAQGLQRARMPA